MATGRLPVIELPGEEDDARPGGHRGRRVAVRVLAAAGTAVAVVVALWALDSQLSRGKVARNVTLGGRPVGGMARPELAAAVADLSQRYADAPVAVEAPGGGFDAGAAELGLSVRNEATVEAALAEGRHGFVGARIVSWAVGFVSHPRIPVAIAVDEKAVGRVVAERDPQRVAPVEPTLAVKSDRLVAEPGKPGRGVTTAAMLHGLRRAGPGGLPLKVSVTRSAVPPRFTVDEAQRLADRAEQLVAPGLAVTAGPATATVPASTLRTIFTAVPEEQDLRLAVDPSNLPAALTLLFPSAVVAPVNAGFNVSGGKVSITPAKAGQACCAPEAATVIQNALLSRQAATTPVALPLKTVPAPRDEAAAAKLGVVEQVGTFTTNHAAGEPRVKNIHLIADMIRGQVIAPGETFSVNNFVGPRTAAKGFVNAPTIDENYKFVDSVGGGISQFATTIFNAAFFSGLDIPSYYMHGIYISRYPYGRESTISYPEPDVRIRNNTPYGVLLWPTYTDTSITVTMYSTKNVVGEQTAQTTEAKGPCTAVTTERTRTYLADNRKVVDRFHGLYSPGEGIDCK
jgi:vancomycin resistance protein YoaR